MPVIYPSIILLCIVIFSYVRTTANTCNYEVRAFRIMTNSGFDLFASFLLIQQLTFTSTQNKHWLRPFQPTVTS